MIFLSTGEKIKKLREQPIMKQQDFNDENMTRSHFGMLETVKRKLNNEIVELIIEKMKSKAIKCGIEFNVNSPYFMISEKDDAREYCLNQIKWSLDDNLCWH